MYGNSGGKNKGKKYTKLQGWEVATPESQARARAFMAWYGANFELLKRKLIYKGERDFNDEVATDTALLIYDAIALKGVKVQNFAMYYFRAYRTNELKNARLKNNDDTVSLDTPFDPKHPDMSEDMSLHEVVAAPDFDYATYEAHVDQLENEILEYVRAEYPPFECSLFEIYVGLSPNISYKRLSVMLGISFNTIWQTIGAIRKDVAIKFKARRDYLLAQEIRI